MTRLVAVCLMTLTACGYHISGHGDVLLPKNIKVIAIPAFSNLTTRYKLADRLPADITRELIRRTRYQVVADPSHADALLTGALINFTTYPSIFDPVSGRATGVQAIVVMQIMLTERSTGKVLFNRPGLEIRERYEISVDPRTYFDQSDVAMQRLSGDVARYVVSSILEFF